MRDEALVKKDVEIENHNGRRDKTGDLERLCQHTYTFLLNATIILPKCDRNMTKSRKKFEFCHI